MTRPPARDEAASARRRIPFDYTFRFDLTGEPGRVHNASVVVSIEAEFVANAVGFGLIPGLQPIVFGPGLEDDFRNQPRGNNLPASPRTLGNVSFRAILRSLRREIATRRPAARRSRSALLRDAEVSIASVMQHGIRLNPAIADRVLAVGDQQQLPPTLLSQLFIEDVPPAEEVQFLYALFDDGSGRAFQEEPVLSTAGLGSAAGERPFRPLTPPITFAPRATIRMQVTERSRVPGELHISLHGQRVLGAPDSPTGMAAMARRRRR